MARNGIQYSDVQQAIDDLLARGDTPSVQRIRDVLGTGSFTTISEHFRHWRHEREQNKDVPPPRGVPEVVVNVASEIWRQAQEVAHQGLIHYRNEADKKTAEAVQMAKAADERAANAEQRESALAEHLRHTEQRLETLNRELAASQAAESQWQQTAENEIHKAKQYRQQLAQSEREVAELKEHFADEQRKHQTEWEQRLAQEEQRNEAAEGKLMTLLDTLRQERAQEEKEHHKRFQKIEQRSEELVQELQLKKDTLQNYVLDNSRLQQRVDELERMHESYQAQQARLQRELEHAGNALEQYQQMAEKDKNWQQQLCQQMEMLQAQLNALPEALAPQEKEDHFPGT